jgi:hypothetical protein
MYFTLTPSRTEGPVFLFYSIITTSIFYIYPDSGQKNQLLDNDHDLMQVSVFVEMIIYLYLYESNHKLTSP